MLFQPTFAKMLPVLYRSDGLGPEISIGQNKHGAPGIPSKGVPQLADGIHELPDLPEQWQKAPQSERGYYLENHVVDTAVERFERVTAVCH